MARDFKIPRLYKTLLALAAVLGPIYWLMLTEDGQRRTDLTLMWILGRPSFDAALESFSDRLSEARLRETFPAIDFQCSDGTNPFGDRLCAARIGSFNQYPARGLSLYFDEGRLSAVKILIRRPTTVACGPGSSAGWRGSLRRLMMGGPRAGVMGR